MPPPGRRQEHKEVADINPHHVSVQMLDKERKEVNGGFSISLSESGA